MISNGSATQIPEKEKHVKVKKKKVEIDDDSTGGME